MKKNILFTTLFLCIIFTSLSQNKTKTVKLTIDTSVITILNIDTSENSILNNAYMAWRDGYNRKLTLTNRDIKLIDELLKKTIDDYNLSADSIIVDISADSSVTIPDTIRLSDYKRQYFPYIDKEGKRKVWLNIFCESDSILNWVGINWKKNPLLASDGGKNYFQLIVNLTDRSVSNFELNDDVGGYIHKPRAKKLP